MYQSIEQPLRLNHTNIVKSFIITLITLITPGIFLLSFGAYYISWDTCEYISGYILMLGIILLLLAPHYIFKSVFVGFNQKYNDASDLHKLIGKAILGILVVVYIILWIIIAVIFFGNNHMSACGELRYSLALYLCYLPVSLIAQLVIEKLF